MLGRFFKRLGEKIDGEYFEGPNELPPRFVRYIDEFMVANPKGSRAQFKAMIRALAAETYFAGFQRGYEWAERDEDRAGKYAKPDQVAEFVDPNWALNDPVDLANPSDVVPDRDESGERVQMSAAFATRPANRPWEEDG